MLLLGSDHSYYCYLELFGKQIQHFAIRSMKALEQLYNGAYE